LISDKSEKLIIGIIGLKAYLILFGWLGTSVHELGHALFALIFRHKITEIKLFTPRSETGTLGNVNHSYNPRNLYQSVGNFFIGIGPIILGTLLLYLLLLLLFDFSLSSHNYFIIEVESLVQIDTLVLYGKSVLSGYHEFIEIIFHGSETKWWKVVLFIYLLFSIGSSITLSRADVSGAWSGILAILLCLLIINMVTLWTGEFVLQLFLMMNSFFSGFYFIFLFTIFVNLSFMILFVILKLGTSLIRG